MRQPTTNYSSHILLQKRLNAGVLFSRFLVFIWRIESEIFSVVNKPTADAMPAKEIQSKRNARK